MESDGAASCGLQLIVTTTGRMWLPKTLTLLEVALHDRRIDAHLCLVVGRSGGRGCDLVIVLIVDGGALKGGFEVCNVGHGDVEMQAGATGSRQYGSKRRAQGYYGMLC
jgi:hypothetical protein